MKLLLSVALLPGCALAQICAPAGSLAPTGTVSSALTDSSCRLPDGTQYAAYRLTLPTRGQIQFDAAQGDVTLVLRDSSGGLVASGKGIRRPIERGTYTLLAAGSGGYVLRSAFTAAPALMCRDFPSIGINQPVTGTLGGSGCTAPDGSAFEAWALHTYGSGMLSVRVDATGFTPLVTLRGEDGRAIASGDGSLSYPVLDDQRFTIVVASPGGAGSFTLTTSFRADDAETCRAQTSFPASDHHAGIINLASCATVVNNLGDLAYFNYYEVTAVEAGTAEVIAASTAFNPILYLRDASGSLVATDQLGGGKGRSVMRLQLAPGSYIAEVRSAQAAGGTYTLDYTFTPGAAPDCAVNGVAPGDSVHGAIAAASCRTPLGAADLYSFTLPAAGTLELNLTALDFPPVTAILDAQGNVVVWDQLAQGLALSRLLADLPAGTYTVVAAAASAGGPYDLDVKFIAKPPGACPAPTKMDPNTGYIQVLGISPCRGVNGQPLDTYEVTLPSAGTLAAVMTSTFVDGYLTLTAPGGLLRSDDNTYGAGDPLLIDYLPAGTYQLAARASQNSFGGLYRLDVIFRGGDRPAGCSAKASIALGSSADDALTLQACAYPDDTFADIYIFSLTDTTAVDIKMISGDFDPALVLLDAKGNVVDEDDDSGGGSNARIRHLLAPGTYYVAAKASSDYASLGGYTLSVTAP